MLAPSGRKCLEDWHQALDQNCLLEVNEGGQTVVEFQRDPTRDLSAVSTVLGPEVHDLVS
jgi:hypothetical protein